jgi:hypothetical protein
MQRECKRSICKCQSISIDKFKSELREWEENINVLKIDKNLWKSVKKISAYHFFFQILKT